jgi:hypothetical protein
MRTYDYSPLWRSTIGFDRLLTSRLNEPARIITRPTTSNGWLTTATRFLWQWRVLRPSGLAGRISGHPHNQTAGMTGGIWRPPITVTLRCLSIAPFPRR